MSEDAAQEARWAAVDSYIGEKLLGSDPVMRDVLESSEAAGLPSIAVSPAQGKFLFLLARMMAAKNVLELGTLGGYSGVWLARALPPDGQLVTIDIEPEHTAVAMRNFERAGVTDRVDARVGPALELLPRLKTEQRPPFDLVFIDADKAAYPEYLDWAIALCRPGGLIVTDNVVRGGAVIDGASSDPMVQGVRRFMDKLQGNPKITATVIQTVGAKGYDGLALIQVAQS